MRTSFVVDAQIVTMVVQKTMVTPTKAAATHWRRATLPVLMKTLSQITSFGSGAGRAVMAKGCVASGPEVATKAAVGLEKVTKAVPEAATRASPVRAPIALPQQK